MKVRKIPVEVEAWDIQFLLDNTILEGWPDVLKCAYEQNLIRQFPTFLEVRTLEGWVKGHGDCMLIMGVEREFYPCEKEIFKKTYEILDPQPSV